MGLSILVKSKYGFAPSAHFGRILSSILCGSGGVAGGDKGDTSSLRTSGPAEVRVEGVADGRNTEVVVERILERGGLYANRVRTVVGWA